MKNKKSYKELKKEINRLNDLRLKSIINLLARDEILESYYYLSSNNCYCVISRLNEEYPGSKEQIYTLKPDCAFIVDTFRSSLYYIEYVVVQMPRNCIFVVSNANIKNEVLEFNTIFICKDDKVYKTSAEKFEKVAKFLGMEIPEEFQKDLFCAKIWHKVAE